MYIGDENTILPSCKYNEQGSNTSLASKTQLNALLFDTMLFSLLSKVSAPEQRMVPGSKMNASVDPGCSSSAVGDGEMGDREVGPGSAIRFSRGFIS